LPLGTKVDIFFLPLKNYPAASIGLKNLAQSAGARAKAQGLIPPTAKQICSREDCGELALEGALARLDSSDE
jgi:hypothetical protein